MTVKPCSNMWESIIVESGGALVANNVTFTGGHRAITAEDGSTISIKNCQFTDNYIGVYTPVTNSTAQNINVQSFYNNIFEGTGNMPLPYDGLSIPIVNNRPYTGVEINDATGFDIAGVLTVETAFYNKFRNMQNGIVARRSSLSVSGSTFEDLDDYGIRTLARGGTVSNLVCTGIGSEFSFEEPTFRNCRKAGISMIRTISDIQECRMIDVPKGIEVSNAQYLNVNIENNIIEAQEVGVLTRRNSPVFGTIQNNRFKVNGSTFVGDENINTTAISCYENNHNVGSGWLIDQNEIDMRAGDAGIYYNGGASATISNNSIFVLTQSQKPTYYTGVQLDGTTKVSVSCNDVVGTNPTGTTNFTGSTGYYLKGAWNTNIECNDASTLENGFFFKGACDATSFRANAMRDYAVGLSLDASAIMGGQVHHGNMWEVGTNTNNHTDAFHGSSLNLDWDESTFVVSCPLDATSGYNPAWCPDDVEVNGGGNAGLWIQKNFKEAETYVCTEDCSNNLQGDDEEFQTQPSKLEFNIAQNKLEHRSDVTQWTLQQHLYQNLQNARFDISEDDGTMQQFINNYQETDAGYLYQIQESLNITTSSAQIKQMQHITDLMQQLDAINSALYESNSESEIIYLLDEKAEIRLDILEEQTILNESLTTQYQEVKQRVKNATFYQERLDKSTLYQQNLFTVQQIYLNTLANGTEMFSALQIRQLRDIAYQCPLTGGDAVFMARSLYSFIDTPYYDDEVLCTSEERSKMASKELVEETSVKVYPNPANEVVTFEMQSDEITTLRLYNMLGVEVIRTEIPKGSITHQIDISHLPFGVYTWTLDHDHTASGKLIINK